MINRRELVKLRDWIRHAETKIDDVITLFTKESNRLGALEKSIGQLIKQQEDTPPTKTKPLKNPPKKKPNKAEFGSYTFKDTWEEIQFNPKCNHITVESPVSFVLTLSEAGGLPENNIVFEREGGTHRFDLRPEIYPLDYSAGPKPTIIELWSKDHAEKTVWFREYKNKKGLLNVNFPKNLPIPTGIGMDRWSVQYITKIGWRIVSTEGDAPFLFGLNALTDNDLTNKNGEPILESSLYSATHLIEATGANCWGRWVDPIYQSQTPMPYYADLWLPDAIKFLPFNGPDGKPEGSRPVPDVADPQTRRKLALHVEDLATKWGDLCFMVVIGNEWAVTPGRLSDAMVATQYLSELIRNYAPHVLVGGQAWMDTHFPLGAIKKESEYVDIHCINSYRDHLPTAMIQQVRRESNRPVFICETNAALDSDPATDYKTARYPDEEKGAQGTQRLLNYCAHPATPIVGISPFPAISTGPSGRISDGEVATGLMNEHGQPIDWKCRPVKEALALIN